MKVTHTTLDGVLLLEPAVFVDERGFFLESFNQKTFELATGLHVAFVQDNHSHSTQDVLRGLHYQTQQMQGKLVRVTHGAVFDVVVDIRPNSPTYGAWEGFELTHTNQHQVWIPPGLAHGFLTLSEWADVLYKTTDYYAPEFERCIAWNDPSLKIAWPLSGRLPKMSAKDRAGQFLERAN